MSGGRVVELVRAFRGQIEGIATSATGPGEALRALDQIERAVATLEDVAVDSFGSFERQVRDLSLLRRTCDLVVSIFECDRFCRSFLAAVAEEQGAAALALDLLEDEGRSRAKRVTRGCWPAGGGDAMADACADLALRTGPLHLADVAARADLRDLGREAGWRSALVRPIATLGRPVAVLQLFDPEPGRFGAGSRQAIAMVADLVGVALRHLQLSADAVAPPRHVAPELWPSGWSFDHARLALARREKLSALAKLAASVSHEINNPMSYVLSNLGRGREEVERLAKLFDAPESGAAGEVPGILDDLRALLDEIEEGLYRVRRVAAELHGLGPRRDERPEPVDLNALVQTAVEMARVEADSPAGVELRLEPLPAVRCRRFQVVQAVFDLVTNALEAVTSSGAVRVTTLAGADAVRIEVADDGPGVPAEHRARIFEPFYSTKLDGRAGFGLAIARDVARAHRGSLVLSGEAGAVFTLTLPLVAPDPAEPASTGGGGGSRSSS